MKRYAIVIEDGGTNLAAYVPDLPGCVATGDTEQEVERLIREAIALHLGGWRRTASPSTSPRVAWKMWRSTPNDQGLESAQPDLQSLGSRSPPGPRKRPSREAGPGAPPLFPRGAVAVRLRMVLSSIPFVPRVWADYHRSRAKDPDHRFRPPRFAMRHRFTLEYWRDGDWFVGRLIEVPAVFSQGKTLDELSEGIQDAYELMVTQDRPPASRNR